MRTRPVATTKDLQDIMNTIDSLQSRVQELSDENVAVENVPPVLPPAHPTVQPAAKRSPSPVGNVQIQEVSPEALTILRRGISELSTMSQFKEFPKYFIQLAARTGLRLTAQRKIAPSSQRMVVPLGNSVVVDGAS